jgi:oxygen-independent coproporphyrinogen-3 oxidase
VATVYIGGGTPSVLSVAQWQRLLDGLRTRLRASAGREWTVECNPESWSAAKAELWLASGINRISLGVQSLDDRELMLLGRPHNAAQALAVLRDPLLGRFASVSADVMYGLPGQSLQALGDTLRAILGTPYVRHVSAYELTVVPHTRLGRHPRLFPLPPEERALQMLQLVADRLAGAGYERYEISNYAQAGHRCRHNLVYWRHGPYLGLGPAAHSYLAPARFANIADVDEYVSRLRSGERPLAFEETVDAGMLGAEMIMLGLRTSDGVDSERFRGMTGAPFVTAGREPVVDELLSQGLMCCRPPCYVLTPAGMLVADAIAVRLASAA